MRSAGVLRRVAAIGLSVALAMLVSGCALESSPLPPSLHIPKPVQNLTATRAGSSVTLKWTMPKRTTDKVLLKGKHRVEICRLRTPAANAKSPNQPQPCQLAGNVTLHSGAAAKFVDHLPAALEAGPPRPLTYAVRVYGPYQRNAGYSNRAMVVAGSAPPPVGDVTTQVRPDGIVLRWTPQAPAPHMEMRMVRTLVAPKHQTKPNPQQGAAPVQRQVLKVSLARHDAGQALDRNATLNHTYQYVLQRVIKLTLNGKTAQLAGAASPAVIVHAKDVFAPSPPQGLAAVPDSQSASIDLSWEPSPQANVAGYIVYRRKAAQPGPWRRISPAHQLLTAPAWQDSTAQPGISYEYAVTAVNKNGNQSARSASVQEELSRH